MNWHITKSQDTGRRQIKQKKKKKHNTENSKDEQHKNKWAPRTHTKNPEVNSVTREG